jgi:MinD-like ATPase involved in chromosome partitioning or flagellar assembly
MSSFRQGRRRWERCPMETRLEIALAASARDWPDRLHRHVLDHGGARVSGRLLGAAQCFESRYSVLFVDDVCSFLSPRLVALVREQGRVVIGVYDPADGPDAKRRLLECGISDVIESDATPDEFVRMAEAAVEVATPARANPSRRRRGRAVAVAGVVPGVGATEIAVGISWGAAVELRSILVDLDPAWPSVSPRLDLRPHPNLFSLVDVALHQGDVADVVETTAGPDVVPGSPWLRDGSRIPAYEVAMAVGALAEVYPLVVADVGAMSDVLPEVLREFDSLVLVASGDPVGVARLVKAAPQVHRMVGQASLLVVANRCLPGRFHVGEVRSEVASAFPDVPVVTIPADDRVARAAWDGVVVSSGRFARAMQRISQIVVESVSS